MIHRAAARSIALWSLPALLLGACGPGPGAGLRVLSGKADSSGSARPLLIVNDFTVTPQASPSSLVFAIDLLIDGWQEYTEDPVIRIELYDRDHDAAPLLTRERTVSNADIQRRCQRAKTLAADPCAFFFEEWTAVPRPTPPQVEVQGPLTAKLFVADGSDEPALEATLAAWLPPSAATVVAPGSSLPLILFARNANGDLADQYYSRPAPAGSCPTGDSPCAYPLTTMGDAGAEVLVYGVVPAELPAPRLCVQASDEAEPTCTSWVARQYRGDGWRYLSWPEPDHAGLTEEDRNKAPLVPQAIRAGTLYQAWVVAGVDDGFELEQPVRVYYGSATQYQELQVDRARFMSGFCGAGATLTDGLCTCDAGRFDANQSWQDGCESTEPAAPALP